ncbi:hypothetical protein GCM10018793_22800 [Streptomyces sulfonofaciens]|uniref:Uncharacterized protein n=1 Tax=Streptomyces sulfonofaciens TaxID=68272 RepID=A0A919KYC2_9ACTN|nr:DUF6412 domain-containing protein [Streptomyces sulfonofaciens]GHH76629.1 hypothetical protein GCM10018793_22800 [Streptomyces sulfonofaciens]
MTVVPSVPTAVRRALRPALLLVFLLAEAVLVALAGAGGVPVAVAFAATAAVGASLVLCSVLIARSAPAVPPTRVRTALRERAQRTAFLPQRDPDAPGRSRPRAPGRPSPTAA